nr:MAG TPA: hypothetical protein [Bacteriophage sp.]DAI57956.1 MAG TPA: hypothetical protein [Caudoviricetes sp.]
MSTLFILSSRPKSLFHNSRRNGLYRSRNCRFKY